MSDISKCENYECPLKEHCYRWTAPANKFRQTYADFKFTITDDGRIDCEYYWGSSVIRNKIIDKDGKL